MDFKRIEKKWQKKWEETKVFEANPSKKRKFFINIPYPYANAYLHLGHFYTWMRGEAFARYKRMCGYNVLFPQGFHCTGSPIVSAAKRIEEGEEKQIKVMKSMGFSDEEIKKFADPIYWIKVFPKEIENDLKNMGFSIDWRRSFITTSLNPYYDKFVKWQFNKLREKNLIEKGKHPVVWDPKTNMPVGDHDRIKGEGEVPQEFCLFKFKLDDGRNIITATLRPDTIWGITNIYVNPDVEYMEIETKNEKWILGEPTIDKLKNQDYKINIKGKVKGADLIGKSVESFGNKKILVLPATFLDPNYGTGMVHSVPSDSADDLIALQDLQKNDELIKKYNLNPKEVKSIRPIEIFETPGIDGNSAQYFLDKYNVKSQNEKLKLENIRSELYKLTFSTSKLNQLYKKGFSRDLSGMLVSEAQPIIKKDLLKQGKIELFYELTGEVISRSLSNCIIKIVNDQWFIKYGDKRWKKIASRALKNIELYPKKAREQFNYVIGWLKDWACTREFGLGTKLPWDEHWVIESLSDSTVYMAYYTIAHLIKNIPIEKINDEFFDYIFLGKGKKPDIKNIEKMKNEFNYWYPFDFRNSGKDLIQNHLTFCIFNHTAIFPEKYWPKGIGVNGWTIIEGQKMSKSLGNFILIRDLHKDFSSDTSRISILSGGESLDDPNWSSNFAKNMEIKLEQLYEFSIKNYNKGTSEIRSIDKWMDSRLNKIIKDATEFMENTLFRSAIQRIYFDLQKDLKWYLRRTLEKPNKKTINKFIEIQLLLLSPFAPHLCEEIWERLNKKKFISLSSWPDYNESKIDKKLDLMEELIKNVLDDIRSVLKLTKLTKPNKIILYIAEKDAGFKILKEEQEFLEKELNTKIEIWKANDPKKNDPMNKAMKAKPLKPAIYIE